ncbi:MAG: 50S ribosomal protein L4 [Candidatus Acetothermia bacterium]|jgi:large subunit ribosomal protein L4|nr:50S ribosomal protein L4 [Candidatus Acetothermia bacterium]MDH7505552.1 50S ribosomal protein L4 [Candidatus Acetothermia bacterium]
MEKVKLYKSDGAEAGEVEFPSCLLEEEVDLDLLHRAVQYSLVNRRRGTASTKTRGEVRGGGRKPWRQKHTGRARHGSRRSPIWRGGGVTFGPRPREYSFALPKKMRRKSLRMALTAKHNEKRLALLEELAFAQPKTKEALRLLEGLGYDHGAEGKVLILISAEEDTLAVRKSFSNIPWVKCLPASGANVYDLLKYEGLLMTQGALNELKARLC